MSIADCSKFDILHRATDRSKFDIHFTQSSLSSQKVLSD